MTTSKQIAANQANALLSTGPKTEAGKRVVSMNAISHGILSRRGLFLSEESPTEYQCLLDDLMKALSPAGALERVLVEKVAVAIWKQKRLVAAESAAIELHRAPSPSSMLDDLMGPNPEQKEWRYVKASSPISNDLLIRYQIALDGELYRALDALRKQQDWRMRSGIGLEAERVA